MRNCLGQFVGQKKGNVALIFGLCAVPVALAIFGTVEIGSIAHERQALQNAVDEAALAGAGRMTMGTSAYGDNGASAFAVDTAEKTLRDGHVGSQAAFTAGTGSQTGTFVVSGTSQHKAVIGFMGFGDETIHATATAETLASIPLCILQTGTGNNGGSDGPPAPPTPPGGPTPPSGPAGTPTGPALKGGISLNDNSHIRATGCAIHANQNIAVSGNATIQASRAEAVGTITGPVTPQGFAGSGKIDDPFEGMILTPPTSCQGKAEDIREKTGETVYLTPGVHCEHYKIERDATLVLEPGEHYFMDNLDADANAIVQGDDVVLIFGSGKAVNFVNHAAVRLTARKSGPFAGFLIVTSRANHQHFTIASNNVSELLGTIYIPNAELDVETSGNVAQDSAWSIIVADHLVLRQNPSLIINSGYIGSGVPVPNGVGPGQTAPRLTN